MRLRCRNEALASGETLNTPRNSINRARRIAAGATFALVGILAIGCTRKEETVKVRIALDEPLVLAVAPVLNFTGAFDLDPVRVADLLASELTFVEGATVLPVNRVVAVLAAQGKLQIESPAHAIAVAEAVGADGILVAGITEYDAYVPAMVVVLQLYEVRRTVPARGLDPMTVARQAQPVQMTETTDALSPTAQVQVVYNATHGHVMDAVKAYGSSRSEDMQMGWRQYLKVQTLYIRFCWHDALTKLLTQRRFQVNAWACVESPENQ